jgi:hypothetical protein
LFKRMLKCLKHYNWTGHAPKLDLNIYDRTTNVKCFHCFLIYLTFYRSPYQKKTTREEGDGGGGRRRREERRKGGHFLSLFLLLLCLFVVDWIIYRLITPLTGKMFRSGDQSMENKELLNLDGKRSKFSRFYSNFYLFIQIFTF